MFLRKIRTSITKLILPSLYLILKLLKANTRTVNFLNDKKTNANNSYNFQTNIEKLLKNKKLIGLDVGAQGGHRRLHRRARRALRRCPAGSPGGSQGGSLWKARTLGRKRSSRALPAFSGEWWRRRPSPPAAFVTRRRGATLGAS